MTTWFYWRDSSLFLHIQLQPHARHDEIVGLHGDYLKIRITAAPIDGRANDHLIKFLAQCFNVAQQQVIIINGEQSKIKLIRIDSPNDVSMINENCFRK